jgi:hypothetical protein
MTGRCAANPSGPAALECLVVAVNVDPDARNPFGIGVAAASHLHAPGWQLARYRLVLDGDTRVREKFV